MATSIEEQMRQQLAARSSLLNTSAINTGPIRTTTSADDKYKTNLHWMEQQALDLWGYTHVPTEGAVWQNIYKADGSVVAVRRYSPSFMDDGGGTTVWRAKNGRKIRFYLSREEVSDNGSNRPHGDQPFPLWLQRERDAMAKRWWRFWK